MNSITRLLITLLLLSASNIWAQQLKRIPTGISASFRGLSVPDSRVAWVSGSKGYVGISTNGGIDWHFGQVKGYEQCDFRSIYAFDDQRAVIANAGSPAYILITSDAGKSWAKVYEHNDSAAFLDGLAFHDDNNGIIYGDPIKGRMLVLKTSDGGRTWKEQPAASRPELGKDEASFAASGTAIRCIGKQKVMIATGGKTSRLLSSDNNGNNWKSIATPIIHGLSSTGIFSFACAGDHIIITGGDYQKETLCTDHVFYSDDGGQHWEAPATATRGYRECVEFIDAHSAIAAGPTGIDISHDLGHHWQPLCDEKQLHVVRKSRKGNLILLAGGEGKICILEH